MFKRSVVAAFAAVLCSSGAFAALPPYQVRPDETFDPVRAGWTCVFEDEFEGTTLDTNKWYRPHFCRKGMKIEPDGYGHLVFHMKKDEKGKLPNGYVYSTAEETYGYYEARVKFTADDGWWAASWIYAGSAGNPFLDGMEIDTFEDFYLRLVDGHFLRDRIASSIHCTIGGKVTSFQQHYAVPGDLKGWHRIGCKWDPLAMSFYLDGRLVASYSAFTSVACIRPLHAILSAERRRGEPWLGGVARDGTKEGTYEIDYVKIWKDPDELKGVKIVWTGAERENVFAPTGSVARLGVSVASDDPNDPVDQVYLFDNGFPLGETFEFPHTFKVPLTEAYFKSADYGHFRMRPHDGPERPFDGYPHTFVAFARTKSGRVARTEPLYRIPLPPPAARPFEGRPAAIPGTVEAWRFDEGGQDVAYHAIPPRGGKPVWRPTQARPAELFNNTRESVEGFAGAWLNYSVDVAKTADYDATFYYGTAIRSANSAVLLVDGAVAGEFAWPAGRDYSWKPADTAKAVVRLPQGRHVLTVLIRSQVAFGKLVFAERQTDARLKVRPFAPHERVSFIGDSITHGGNYHTHLQLFWDTRFPGSGVRLMNCGRGGGTAGGALKRLDWDLLPQKADRVFVMFGMNDVGRGIFETVEPESYAIASNRSYCAGLYRTNMTEVVRRIRAAGKEVVVMTPTPYDQYGLTYKSKNSAGCNDPGLATLAAFDRGLAAREGLGLVDLHRPLTDFVRRQADFKFCPKDRVHPQSAGHMIVCAEILKAMGVSPIVDETTFDAAGRAEARFEYAPKALPFPVDANYRAVDRVYPLTETLNREMVTVRNLPAGRYRLLANDVEIGRYSSDEFARGVNLALLETPNAKIALEARKVAQLLDNAVGPLRNIAAIEFTAGGKGADVASYESVCATMEKEVARMKAMGYGWAGYYADRLRDYRRQKPKAAEFRAEEEAVRKRLAAFRPVAYTLTVRP